MFHVATATPPFIHFDFFVGDAIIVGIPIGPEVEGVGDVNHDAVIEGQNSSGQQEVVDEDGVLVIDAITGGVLVAGNSGFRCLLARGVCVLHVGAHFDDVKGAVSVPGHGNRLMDVRVTENKVESIAVLELDRFLSFFNGKKSFLVNSIAGLGKQGGGEDKR